ncbi:MAG: hypothetical protein QOC55_938 [Thermoleophilaceae bacterium]|nr:hypothetical protein [Thermoleophilaceae bacterium]
MLAAVVAVVVAIAAALLSGGGSGPKRLLPGGGNASGTYDPLAWSADREQELQKRASEGFSDVVYEKSPGGVVATAKRVARWRPLVDRAAAAYHLDPNALEAIVFLESAGRPDAVAGGDVQGAAGLTQILASTATALLHMKVDVGKSRSLTTRIANATTAAQAAKLSRARRRIDQRFDPAHAIAGAALYLSQAQKHFGRQDMAIATYHMGMGNLENVLARYKAQGGSDKPSYAQLYFDTAPLHRPRAYQLLSSLGDDSSTYLWRVMAAREIMRLYRDDPQQLSKLSALDRSAGGGARRLFPNGAPAQDSAAGPAPRFGPAIGLRFTGAAKTAFAPSAAARAALVYIGAGVRKISGQAPLTITTAHGVRLEVSRHYRSDKQALAFQYMLDRLQAWNLIAWGRGQQTIAIVVGPEAAKVLPSADQLVVDARRR